MMIAKLVDDFLMAGDPSIIEEFYDSLRKKFDTGKLESGNDIMFAGMRVQQRDDFSIFAEMDTTNLFQKFTLTPERRKEHNAPCTPEEVSAFRNLCGRLVYPGQALFPHASVTASLLQQRLPSLTVSDLKLANQALSQLQNIPARITFPSPPSISTLRMIAFSDASHTRSYGQTGLIIGLYATSKSDCFFHFLDFTSAKQRRVTFSSIGAEILAAVDTADRAIHACAGVNAILSSMISTKVTLELCVDSRGLFDTISTLHEGKDYRLRGTVARLRDSFASKEISGIRWIKGLQNIADALTKFNYDMWLKLGRMLSEGILDHTIFSESLLVDSQMWS